MSDDLTGRELGGFRLIERIGSGAHGEVWRARQTRLDRDVAVKILNPAVARDPMAARRFEREGRAAASLDHPNVVPVFEAGESDGIVFIAMRLVDGETLYDRLQRVERLNPADTATVLRPVASALDHAHDRGLVHRDVKPSNILLGLEAEAHGQDSIWLADFGIAASVRDLGTYTTGVLGTAEYMAPEQANAADVDHRADLYGLGCVVYRCLQGQPPFPGDDLISTLMSHVNDAVPTTGDKRLDGFFAVALAKEPDNRFQTAEALVQRLAEIDGSVDEPIAIPKERRPRWMAAAGIAAVLVVGLIGWLSLRGGDSSRSAETATTSNVRTSSSPNRLAPDGGSDLTATSGQQSTLSTSVAEPVAGLIAGGTVEVGTTRSLNSINPHADRFIEPFITGNVLPPLMSVNADWSLTPWLAASQPEVIDTTPLTVRWTLRADAVWDDGTPITSNDVAATLDYIQNSDAELAGTLLYADAKVEIIDDTMFDLIFTEPVGAHRSLFSTIHPVIKAAAYEAHLLAGESASSFLSDGLSFSGGPYIASGFDAGERLTLVKNGAWWGEEALLDRITVRTYESSTAQLDAMESGELDLVYVEDARATDSARARGFDLSVVDVGVADQFLRLDMNTRRGPLSDIAVRQAVAAVVDRSLITDASVTPISGEATNPLQSLVWASAQQENESPFASYGGSASEAAALLQGAGWILGDDGSRTKDGELLEIRLFRAEGSSLAEQSLVQSLFVQLGDAGIRVVVSVLDSDSLFAARTAGEYDAVIALDVVNTDPIAVIFRFGSDWCPTSFRADGCTSAVQTNLTGTRDSVLEELFARSSSEPNEARRVALFVAADARLAELVPSLPLYELPTFVVYTDRLGGIGVDTHRGGPFADMAVWGYLESVELR